MHWSYFFLKRVIIEDFLLTILIKTCYVNDVVVIKPIYLNKGYLFQNKIYCLDKIYFCFPKLKPYKLTLYKLNWSPGWLNL